MALDGVYQPEPLAFVRSPTGSAHEAGIILSNGSAASKIKNASTADWKAAIAVPHTLPHF